MRKLALLLLPWAAIGLATRVEAGAVYIPVSIPSALTHGQISVISSNNAPLNRHFDGTLIPEDTDGTARAARSVLPGISATLSGGTTQVVVADTTPSGLLELNTGTAAVVWTALFEEPSSGIEFSLPVVSSANVLPASSQANLQGLVGDAVHKTDIVLMNLGQSAASCVVALLRGDGTSIVNSATVQLQPLSMHAYRDVLTLAQEPTVTGARATATCNQSFFAYAALSSTVPLSGSIVLPSATGASTLVAPGTAAPKSKSCDPSAAYCFTAEGVVFQATENTPSHGITFNPTPGSYSRLHMSMDVFLSAWSPFKPSGLHAFFWLVKNGNFDMYGYGLAAGPNKSFLLLRHGVELTHPEKAKIQKSFALGENHTYHMDYVYDTAHNFIEWQIFQEDGTRIADLTGVPNVSSVDVVDGDQFICGLGFDGTNTDTEETSVGWIWSNYLTELFN